MAWEYRLPSALAIGLLLILALGIDSSARCRNSKSPMVSKYLRLFGLWALLLLTSPAAFADPAGQDGPWPHSAPPLGLFQLRPAFGLGVTRQVEGLLVQHESLTGERQLLVVEPWNEHQPTLSAEERAHSLAELWRLDTTCRGTGIILVLQEAAPGKVRLGYHPGVGLSKTQVAGSKDLQELEDSLLDWAASGSWDDIAEASTLWLFQSVSSPLLERPELLKFSDKRSRVTTDPRPRTGPERAVPITEWLFGAPLIWTIVIGALLIVLESVRRGLRPQMLLGSRRVVRFGIQDQLRELVRRTLKSSKRDPNSEISIVSLEGQS